MQFKITWLPYEVNLSWIEPCLEKIKECILNPLVQNIAKVVSMSLFLKQSKIVSKIRKNEFSFEVILIRIIRFVLFNVWWIIFVLAIVLSSYFA